MSYIRETFYCINDSTKNIHLRWQNKYYVYAYTVIFIVQIYIANILILYHKSYIS